MEALLDFEPRVRLGGGVGRISALSGRPGVIEIGGGEGGGGGGGFKLPSSSGVGLTPTVLRTAAARDVAADAACKALPVRERCGAGVDEALRASFDLVLEPTGPVESR